MRIDVNINDKIGYERKIAWFYDACKEDFFAFIRKQCGELPMEDLRDLYQEAFIAMHENIRNGKYEERPSCSLKTYLFKIGFHKTLTYFKSRRETVDLDERSMREAEEGMLSEWQDRIYSIVAAMESPCKDILFAFYWDKFSMDEIATRMSYKDATVAKSQKYRCVRKVADVLRQMGITGEKKKSI